MVDCADILEQLKIVFEAFDVDGRGSINADHFCVIAKEHFGEARHKEIVGLIQLLDPEGSGQISFNSFCDGVQIINDMAAVEKCNKQVLAMNSLGTSLTLEDIDGHCEDENSTASTYNEYDDSVMTDMSEENIAASPFLSEGTGYSVDGDDEDSAFANGHLRTDFDSITKSFTDDEEQYEDYGENTDIECDLENNAPVQVYIEDVDKDTESITTNSTVMVQDRRLVTLKRDLWSKGDQFNGARRVTSNEFASQLYRSSSSNNISNDFGSMSDCLGDYAASESDVLELSDKVKQLENQVVDLEEDKASGDDHVQKLRAENTHLMEQLNQMEEQLREADTKLEERIQEEKSRHKEAMNRQEKEMRAEIDSLQNQITEMEDEKQDFLGDIPRLKKENESLRKERDRLMKAFREADDKWFSLSSEYQRQQQQYKIEKEELEEELATNAVLIEEMNGELEELRQYREENQQMNLLRTPSLLDMPGRLQELDIQFKQVKQENALLQESNDELSAQMINTRVTFGPSLLHRGVSKSASFAAEIETASKDDIMQALRDEEKISIELREYIGHILTRILEHNPSLLEIQPRPSSSASQSS
ncbi:rab11 family-interacting protein 4B-like isoform X2 [Anneissia japonica]|uniref:rab11 family-interacting protein 4B-like isoform X2 n=1 Tax=Anneissia japonica TaxID=1529436 RepID=UPI0014258427|nr:rab11 family-interacting protein 4B-like isoform X2 [Anneissia japonica]